MHFYFCLRFLVFRISNNSTKASIWNCIRVFANGEQLPSAAFYHEQIFKEFSTGEQKKKNEKEENEDDNNMAMKYKKRKRRRKYDEDAH